MDDNEALIGAFAVADKIHMKTVVDAGESLSDALADRGHNWQESAPVISKSLRDIIYTIVNFVDLIRDSPIVPYFLVFNPPQPKLNC